MRYDELEKGGPKLRDPFGSAALHKLAKRIGIGLQYIVIIIIKIGCTFSKIIYNI